MVNKFKLTIVHVAGPNPMHIRACAWIYHWTKNCGKSGLGCGPRDAVPSRVAGRGPWVAVRGPRVAGRRAAAGSLPGRRRAAAGPPPGRRGPLGRRGPFGRGPAFSKTQYPSANHASSKPVQIPLLSLEAEACHWPSQVILAHCSLAQWTTANFYCNTQSACKQSMVAACIRLNRCFPQQVWHERLHQFIPRAFSGETIRFVTVSVSVNKSCSVSLVRIVLHPSFSLSLNIFTTLSDFQDKPHILMFLGIALMHWTLIFSVTFGSSAYCDVTFFFKPTWRRKSRRGIQKTLKVIRRCYSSDT